MAEQVLAALLRELLESYRWATSPSANFANFATRVVVLLGRSLGSLYFGCLLLLRARKEIFGPGKLARIKPNEFGNRIAKLSHDGFEITPI
jgi:hypothetical protein